MTRDDRRRAGMAKSVELRRQACREILASYDGCVTADVERYRAALAQYGDGVALAERFRATNFYSQAGNA